MKIIGVVGTRPNFIKMAPVVSILKKHRGIADTLLVHTGQHFDQSMSEIFFKELHLPEPDFHLGIGNFSPWKQSAQIVEKLGDIISKERPDCVIVPGDVNSTLASSIATIRSECKLAHLESGLRSFDRSMPEELNRIATDHLSDFLFVTEPSGLSNLKNEGIPASRVRFVGNTMIDTLLQSRILSRNSKIRSKLGLNEQPFILMTMHRPGTVDNINGLQKLLEILVHAEKKGKVVFPIHPRTFKRLEEFKMINSFKQLSDLVLTEPLGYIDFVALMDQARIVMTDSGGIQEETTILETMCLTLRNNTERPITCSTGTNKVVGTDPTTVITVLDECWEISPNCSIPEGWDGKAANRVVDYLLSKL